MPRDGFPGVPRKRGLPARLSGRNSPTPARMRRRPTGSRRRLTRPRRPARLQPRRSGDAPRCGGRPRSARHRRRPQPLPVPAATILRPPPRSREPSSGPNRPATRGRRVSRPPTRPRSQRRRSPRDVRTFPRCRLPDRSGRRGTGHRPRLRGRTLPTLVRRSTPARGGGRLPPRRGAAPTALYRRRRGRRCSPRRLSVRGGHGRSLSSACPPGQRRTSRPAPTGCTGPRSSSTPRSSRSCSWRFPDRCCFRWGSAGSCWRCWWWRWGRSWCPWCPGTTPVSKCTRSVSSCAPARSGSASGKSR